MRSFQLSTGWLSLSLQRSLLAANVRIIDAHDANQRLKRLNECLELLSRLEHGRRLVNEGLPGALEETMECTRALRERQAVRRDPQVVAGLVQLETTIKACAVGGNQPETTGRVTRVTTD